MTSRSAVLFALALIFLSTCTISPARAAVDPLTTLVTVAGSAPFDVKIGPDGNTYMCGQLTGDGKVWKIPPGGGSPTVFASGMQEPKGMAFDASGNLYVSDWKDRVLPAVIYKITPGGVRSLFATVAGATYMVFNNAGDLLVGTWAGHKVRKVTPAGVVSDYAQGSTAGGTQVSGLVYDSATDELYFGDGPDIRKAASGGSPVTLIASGLIDIYGLARGPDGTFYASRYSHRDLYSVTGGVASLYAGAHLDDGCNDGPRTGAGFGRFTLPAGLTFSSCTLLIADYGCHSIRAIDTSCATPAVSSSWGRLKAIYR